MTRNDDQQSFLREIDVSRETFARLEAYEVLLRKWNEKINLVSRTSLEATWSRHFLDSAQLLQLANLTEGAWFDLGSGAGFPGMVIAILAAEAAPRVSVTLVESDGRKAAFLATVAREAGVTPKILNKRAEALAPANAQILSARALAPLSVLLGFAERHLAPNGRALFPKGANLRAEVEAARQDWVFEAASHPSKTDGEAVVLEIKGVSRG